MFKRIGLTILMLLGFLVGVSSAVELTCFHGEFVRDKGKPVTESVNFHAIEGPAILKINNGDDNSKKVSSAVISINGVDVVTPDIFNQKVEFVELEVDLIEGINDLFVQLKSKPGGQINVTINFTLLEGQSFIMPLDTSKIFYEPKIGTQIVYDRIITVFQEYTPSFRINEIVDELNGRVVSYSPEVQVCGIEFDNLNSLESLSGMMDILENYPEVEFTVKTLITSPQEISYEIDDPMWFVDVEPEDDDWDETHPEGFNWGLEAIQAPSAWAIAYNLLNSCWGGASLGNIKVGIVDSGFFIDHKDFGSLPISHVKKYFWDFWGSPLSDDETVQCGLPPIAIFFNNHGTHVAGIIGAISHNDIGITGIMWERDLYAYRYDKKSSGPDHILDGVNLLLKKGVKVINLSLGFNYFDWENCVGCATDPTKCPDYLEAASNILEHRQLVTKYMKKWEIKNYDYLIIQAAGNDRIDARNTLYFSTIKDEKYKKRIMIVGSVDQPLGCPDNCEYHLSDHSFWGSNWGSQLDIVAPGNDIYSTLAYLPETTDIDQTESHYGVFWGTSMAAPHVTGVAGMVWNLAPELPAEKIKKILLNSASVRLNDPFVGNISHPFLNAANAVKMVTADEDLDSILDDGDFSGEVGDNRCSGGNVTDCDDNCLNTYNQYQEDSDNNGIGDVCEVTDPISLANGLTYPKFISVDQNSVYWTDEWVSINKIPLNGGAISILKEGTSPPIYSNITNIAVDSLSVYWAESPGGGSGWINKIPVDKDPATPLDPPLAFANQPYDIAIDSTHVYWTEKNSGTPSFSQVRKVPIDGGTVTTLTESLYGFFFTGIAIDNDSVYFAYLHPNSSVYRIAKVSKNGGAVTPLFSSSNYKTDVEVDSTHAYWIEITQPGPGEIKRIPIDGGQEDTLVTGLNDPQWIVVDSENVYWVEFANGDPGSGSIKRVPKSGGVEITLENNLNGPYDLAVDDNYVYWTEQGTNGTDGMIKKISKNTP